MKNSTHGFIPKIRSRRCFLMHSGSLIRRKSMSCGYLPYRFLSMTLLYYEFVTISGLMGLTLSEDVVRDEDQPQDTLEPKTYKTLNQDWFKQPPRPPTPDPEWNKRQVILDQPEQPWFNQMIDNLTQDLLLGPAYNLLKGTCTSSIELEYNFQECFNALTNKLDWNNLEGDRYPFDLSKPLPLQGRPDHLTVAADYFFNNDQEFLKISIGESYTTSITKTKATRYEIVGIEDMTPTL
ncbi:hypothetical protein Tco_0678167 [Tanacetum coccineum]|uniref:Uncharacterized protein n=1 Tax=Tanacetum coccineum TaxID=301880 RepID=A0ABQ4XF61_9ASTR